MNPFVNLWQRLPSLLGVRFAQRMNTNFGWRFVVILFSTYFGIKGIVYFISRSAFLPFLRIKLGVDDAPRFQALFTVSLLPWSLKPLIGMVSDVLPIGGYYKRWYIVGSAVIGTAACAVLASAPIVTVGEGALAAVLFFFIHVESSASDLLVEGIYSEKMVQKPESGADMVTTVWALQMVATLAGACIVGVVADKNPSIYIWICLPFAAQIVLPVAAGWLGEERTTSGFRKAKLVENGHFFFIGSVMAAGALGLGAASLWGSTVVQAAYSMTIGVVLCALSLWLLPPMLGKAQVYMFLSSAMNLSIIGAMQPFYISGPECNPGGPQFDLAFFLSWSAALGAVAGLLGVVIFQRVLSRTFYRRAFWTTTVLEVAAAIVDIAIVQRWNIRAGISDRLFYLLGDSIIQDVVVMMDFMPEIVLISKLCPPGMESTVYALLAGFSNFGTAVGSSIGAFAIDQFDIVTTKGGPCDFSNLTWLIIVAHIILPLLTVPLTFLLIPDARMTDDLLGVASGSHAGDVEGGAKSDVPDGQEGGATSSDDDAGALTDAAAHASPTTVDGLL
ncbi:hypothetical protein BU14_0159s0032 [Porphyra umbilicalis]|uniref:Folate/biopterin transporter n=1 Tax=Porphyra umbilicalis TaxID=2786 RepID=A0A1X6P8N2_PORUM|nr:hypothetical protein BU14_0159s0032 [Porphyra umbilicalis]|eukprot:OSX77177.1 hypothetical protein BU14_0159s0032 [Porphyra umbilicalis]